MLRQLAREGVGGESRVSCCVRLELELKWGVPSGIVPLRNMHRRQRGRVLRAAGAGARAD